MYKLIVQWSDTGKTAVKEFRTAEELIEYASIAKMLNAKICWQLSTGEWIWS